MRREIIRRKEEKKKKENNKEKEEEKRKEGDVYRKKTYVRKVEKWIERD